MRYQTRTYTCGPATIVNALRVFGVRVSEKKVAEHAGTTKKDGTGQFGMLQAVERLGYEFKEILSTNQEEAWVQLNEALGLGNPVILSANGHEHWIVAIALIGTKVVIIDSERTANNKKENGTWILTKGQLFKKMWLKAGDSYYGIVIQKEAE
jgi:ABC-type bacteriocin/lantibiotic exporter with double-glycine peptidase domain